MSYDIGDFVTLSTEIRAGDPAVLIDATVSLVITAPDGSLTSVPSGSVSHDGTGLYSYSLTATMPGNWLYVWTASGAASGVDQGQFYVTASGSRIISLADAKRHLSIKSETTDNQILDFIDAAQGIIEDLCGPFVPVTKTELYSGHGPVIALRTWPALSVTSVVETWVTTPYTLHQIANLGDSGSTGYDFLFNRSANTITRRVNSMEGCFYPGLDNIKITYVAGRAEPFPPVIRLATMELTGHLWKNSQQSQAVARPGIRPEESVVQHGYGYSIPNRVSELIAPFRRPIPVQ